MVIDMIDCDFEIKLISREILKKYNCYDYKFVYKVALDLFNYGIRYYMFLDEDDKIGVWEIVEYVLNKFNVVYIKKFVSCVINDNVYYDGMDNASVINISDTKFRKKLKRGYSFNNKNKRIDS